MNFGRKTIILLAISVGLVGCGEAAPSPKEVSVAPATATPTSSASRVINDRGQLVKKIGETGGISDPDDKSTNVVSFKVTSIKEHKCVGPGSDTVKLQGRLIAVSIQVETTKDLGKIYPGMTSPSFTFDSFNWRGYDSNGTRMNDVSFAYGRACVDDPSTLLPSQIGPSEKLSGIILLQVTSPEGEISFGSDVDGGWVWKYSI